MRVDSQTYRHNGRLFPVSIQRPKAMILGEGEEIGQKLRGLNAVRRQA